jgi:hypothetical protein
MRRLDPGAQNVRRRFGSNEGQSKGAIAVDGQKLTTLEGPSKPRGEHFVELAPEPAISASERRSGQSSVDAFQGGATPRVAQPAIEQKRRSPRRQRACSFVEARVEAQDYVNVLDKTSEPPAIDHACAENTDLFPKRGRSLFA